MCNQVPNPKAEPKVRKAKRFVDVATAYLREQGTRPQFDGDEVWFPITVGTRQYDIRIWFDEPSSRAHIDCFVDRVFPGSMADAIAAYMSTFLSKPTKVGGQLRIGKEGNVMWSSYCQCTPSSQINPSLVAELIDVGLSTFGRLIDKLVDFVARQSSAESPDSFTWSALPPQNRGDGNDLLN